MYRCIRSDVIAAVIPKQLLPNTMSVKALLQMWKDVSRSAVRYHFLLAFVASGLVIS
jgi:hypothetical protein